MVISQVIFSEDENFLKSTYYLGFGRTKTSHNRTAATSAMFYDTSCPENLRSLNRDEPFQISIEPVTGEHKPDFHVFLNKELYV